MSLRPVRLAAAFTATALAATTLALGAAPAFAADPNDPTFVPTTADLIGVGSDTSQIVMHNLAEGMTGLPGWNNSTPAPTFRIASFAAGAAPTGQPPLQIALPTNGVVTRPNGSTAGKNTLYGAGELADVDFARSSSALSALDIAAGLQAFPFAIDTLQMVVSGSVPSNAPANLTPAQIVGIYSGTITNWNQIDPAKAGVIAPKIPQAGSGTRDFFTAQLTAMNNNVPVKLAPGVAEVQEHSDAALKADPNAIAPFSVGRAKLLAGTVTLVPGWTKDRAIYNVVRGRDQGNADVQAVFGPTGFLCSTAATKIIEAEGFQQFAPQSAGGVCGVATQSAISTFVPNVPIATTTSLTATSTAAGAVTLVAKPTASTAPNGSVTFYEGATVVASGIPLVSGAATKALTGVTPGVHVYQARFVPAGGTVFVTSASPQVAVNVLAATPAPPAAPAPVVKTTSKLKETFKSAVKVGKPIKGKVMVTLANGKPAAGKITVMLGKKTLASGTLSSGSANIKLNPKKLKVGKNKLVATWAGDATANGSTLKFTIKVK